ncbi:MAG: hypothetical protein ACRDPJ_09285 [Nocardioidaceae bacterium]
MLIRHPDQVVNNLWGEPPPGLELLQVITGGRYPVWPRPARSATPRRQLLARGLLRIGEPVAVVVVHGFDTSHFGPPSFGVASSLPVAS